MAVGLFRTYAGAFGGTGNLKNVWIGASWASSLLYFDKDTFANLETDMNFYFYDKTYDEVVAMAGDACFKNASEKAHFYFKDNIPADAEIPEDVKNNMK